jgi:hypothetical protein
MSSKFFPNLDPSFDKFNPEAIPQEWFESETYDENGQYHSYDDKPALAIEYSTTYSTYFRWYNHGVIEREGNKPPIISVKKDEYVTYNANEEEHSFGENPSYIHRPSSALRVQEELWVEWSHNGLHNRDGDLPSRCIYTKDKIILEAYYLKGVLSRLGGKPARLQETTKTWKVNNIAHNSTGPELEQYDEKGNFIYARNALYGVFMSKKLFDKINDFQLDHKIPLWVAFLYELGMITEEDLLFVKSDEKQWESNLPMSWLIRYYHLDEQVCRKKLVHLKKSKIILDFDIEMRIAGFLKSIMEIVKIEEQDTSSTLSEEGKRHD